jgi:1,4-alpha-glucan branching enzyme
MIVVRFRFLTGLPGTHFGNARLQGSWNGWAEAPMDAVVADDGCPAFTATVEFDDSRAGERVRWGVRLDGPPGGNVWGVAAEVDEAGSRDRVRAFTLPAAGAVHEERYHLTWSRRLGAQKVSRDDGGPPGLRFGVWAPNAAAVEVVFAAADRPYIGDDGSGVDPAMPVVALVRDRDGIWSGGPDGAFAQFVGAPFLYRVVTDDGRVVHRTDLASRWQAGRGWVDPARDDWDGTAATLEGTVSCSVVVDQDVVRAEFEPATDPPALVPDSEFWQGEFHPERPVPTRVEDLVIYELHVGALGFPGRGPGTLADAVALLDHLVALGVTAVELMPLAEFNGGFSWGYGNTHHFAIESVSGGRDTYKHFVRECHRRGIAVIQDVVYNHFDLHAARAQWQYDSAVPERNIYYWYEGKSADHRHPDGGYVDNGSSGWAPRYWAEPVRQLFVSSAAELISEFHVDGLRVDLTQAIHRDNRLHADGSTVAAANLFGQKLLRELSITLRTIRPSVFLIAEDHSGWDAVTKPADTGGLGFDATWFAEFYHHLIGDAESAGAAARLLRNAGSGGAGPLPMADFAHQLWRTQFATVMYTESHDEAGNAPGTARTGVVAVGGAPLVGLTRDYAEARGRVVTGLSLLSAGTPMFFMGEEVFAQKPYRFDDVDDAKEDLAGLRAGDGAHMFRFFQDLIRLRNTTPAVRNRHLDVIHADGATRVIAFTRRAAPVDVLVVASLNNDAFPDGYDIGTDGNRLPAGAWQEVFNSDSQLYGGGDVGNFGAAVTAADGRIRVRLPANGFVVLQR